MLSLFANRVAAVCDEMGAVLRRAAFSPNIRDRMDYSCAVFDPHGQLCAQAAHIPVHLGSMAYAMAELVRARTWSAGDMLVLNDPFQGGTHLPDVTLIAPVFCGQRCVAFVANRAHHADIGADSPGSMPVGSRLAGGMAGLPGENRLNDALLPAKAALSVQAGDRLPVATPGGGGFGVPR